MFGYPGNQRFWLPTAYPVITKILKNFLLGIDFEEKNIFLAKDGNQASIMLGLETFDLITSGLHMKNKSGLEFLLEFLKEVGTTEPAIKSPCPF